LSAVSASPFRAPWVEMKYSSTVSPSRKLEVMGVSMISPEGLAISPRIPANWRIWSLLPLAPESAIMKMGLKLFALTFWPLRPEISSTAISAIISEAMVSVIGPRCPRPCCTSRRP